MAGKKTNKLLFTVREAMEMLHMSDRNSFIDAYVNSGILGLYPEPGTGRLLIAKTDIERAITDRLYYRGLKDHEKERNY